jgi:hypothetical protein
MFIFFDLPVGKNIESLSLLEAANFVSYFVIDTAFKQVKNSLATAGSLIK